MDFFIELTTKMLVFILLVVAATLLFHGIGEAQKNKMKIDVSIKITTTNDIQTTNNNIEY